MITKEEVRALLQSTETYRIERTTSTGDMDKFQEAIFNVDKITAFEVVVKPSLSLNLVTFSSFVTKLNETLNDILDFCSTPRSMAEIDVK